MNRISTKMKLLSLAILGLGGIALAGSASAACPSTPSAWSSTAATFGTVQVQSGGLDSSSCRLDTALTGNFGFATAYVADDSPSAESRYRAQFLFNADALAGLNISQVVRIFAANTQAPSQSVPDVVRLTLYGNVTGTSKVLGIATACSSNPNGRCSTAIPLSTGGVQRVEIDWVKGTSGSLKVWLNNNVEGSPDATLSVNNSAWGGVDDAYLGLYAGSVGYRANQLNHAVSFDTFDSRRQTFIGF